MEVYADNAATTRICQSALDAMLPCFDRIYGNPSSLHRQGQKAREALETARAKVACCIGCQPREVYFTSGGSEADHQAILTAADLGKAKGKKHIVTTAFEHHAVLNTLKKLEKQGFTVTYLEISPVTHNIAAAQVQDAIREDTCLVTTKYANNEIGSVLPIREIGAVCRRAGVLFHVDAVQAVGHIPVNVREEQIDLLSLSGHKFHGPKGVGALYARRDLQLVKLIEGGGQERGKRAGTENLPAICGMAAALQEAVDHMEANRIRVTAMRDLLLEGLSRIPHSMINGDLQNRLPGNVSFCFEGIESESLLLLLDGEGICASSGSACSSGSLEPSHVLQAIGRSNELAGSALRISLSRENTMEEVDYILNVVPRVVEHLRSMSSGWTEPEKRPNYL